MKWRDHPQKTPKRPDSKATESYRKVQPISNAIPSSKSPADENRQGNSQSLMIRNTLFSKERRGEPVIILQDDDKVEIGLFCASNRAIRAIVQK